MSSLSSVKPLDISLFCFWVWLCRPQAFQSQLIKVYFASPSPISQYATLQLGRQVGRFSPSLFASSQQRPDVSFKSLLPSGALKEMKTSALLHRSEELGKQTAKAPGLKKKPASVSQMMHFIGLRSAQTAALHLLVVCTKIPPNVDLDLQPSSVFFSFICIDSQHFQFLKEVHGRYLKSKCANCCLM